MFEKDITFVKQFYQLLDRVEQKNNGKHLLQSCDGFMDWPERGVYFFFEPGEIRTSSGEGMRCVRVGTHALTIKSRTSLWNRLSQHKGTTGGINPGGGNHRGSIFRSHVGTALMNRDHWPEEISNNWGGSNAPRPIKDHEAIYEIAISKHIRSMPFIWLAITDEPGPNSMRGYIERNSIALLSNFNRSGSPIDLPSQDWLGQWAKSMKIRQSSLWNSNHVDESFDENFLDVFRSLI